MLDLLAIEQVWSSTKLTNAQKKLTVNMLVSHSRGHSSSTTEPHLGLLAAAQDILSLAVDTTAALGAETTAKGLSRCKSLQICIPSHITRNIRNLDAAAALLRHPG